MSTKEKQELKPLTYIFKPDYKTYHNPAHVLSYKNICNLFLIFGGRGTGKTTGWTDYCAKQYIKKKEQFVYLRRNPNGAKAGRDLLSNMLTPIKVVGMGIEGCYKYMYGNECIGFTLSLTKQNDLKSGFDFSKVTTIIYDECSIKQTKTRRYIQDEPHEFLQLISTIVRTRTNYIIVMLSNNDDKFNIWTEYFNIPLFDNIYVNKEKGIMMEYVPHNPRLLEKEEQTPLYKLTQGTAYGQYHYENEVLSTSVIDNIKEKPEKCKLIGRIAYNNKTLNVYYEWESTTLFVELREKLIDDKLTFKLVENNQPNWFDIKFFKNSDIKQFMCELYYEGRWYAADKHSATFMASIMEEFR